MEKTEVYKGFQLSWLEPPLTSDKWTVNVASDDPRLAADDPRLAAKLGKGAAVISGPTRDAAIAKAKRYVDGL